MTFCSLFNIHVHINSMILSIKCRDTHTMYKTDISCMSNELKSNFGLANFSKLKPLFTNNTNREQWIPQKFFVQFTFCTRF